MTSPKANVQPVVFGPEALAFVQEQLESAARDFEGPLAMRLRRLPLDKPVSFLTSRAVPRAERNWRHGGVDSGGSDVRLAGILSAWLRAGKPEYERVLVLEEPLGRRFDASTPDFAVYQRNRVYPMARGDVTPEHLTRVFRALSGYPGIGVLAQTTPGVVQSEMTEPDLDSLAGGAVAVLVRAWDDEAFLIAPVGSKIARQEVRAWLHAHEHPTSALR